jgi:hypothetical protein
MTDARVTGGKRAMPSAATKGLWEKTIKLTSGGWLKIELVGHPLDMAEDDRTFVEQLVGSINEYESDAKKYGTDGGTTAPGRGEP